MPSLRELQSSFFNSIAHVPGGGSANFDPGLVHLVEGRGQLGPQERINIYAQMYYVRLLEVLHEDFPQVATILGCERFDEVVRVYLACHPSTHPSLRYLGRHFAAFLDTRPEVASLPFLSDLARLEWMREEVFDAPDAEPLRLEHLQGLSADEWPDLRFQFIPAFQVLQSEWPVHEIWAAAECQDGRNRASCPRRGAGRETIRGDLCRARIHSSLGRGRVCDGEPFTPMD